MKKEEEEFTKIVGRGVYSQNGVSFHGDRAIITKDGVSKEVSREEGAAEVTRVLAGGNKILEVIRGKSGGNKIIPGFEKK